MWMVRKGDHTLWILGTISPLPKKMIWQPDAVREVLQRDAGGDAGVADLRHRRQPPHGAARVHRVAPPAEAAGQPAAARRRCRRQLYARVEALKDRYDPKDKQARAHAADAGRARSCSRRVFDAAGLAAAQRGAGDGAAAGARAGRARAPGQAEDRRPGRRAQGRQRHAARPRGGLPGIGGDAARDRPRADAGARAGLGARRCRYAAQAARTPPTAPPASPPSPPPSACAASSRAPRTTG